MAPPPRRRLVSRDVAGPTTGPATRPAASAILYLLAAGERSHWHRVDAAEIWQWSAGEALELRIWAEGDTGGHDGPAGRRRRGR